MIRRNTPPLSMLLLGVVALGAIGCGGEDIETLYGRRGVESVNGTDVFYDLTSKAGHRTSSRYQFVTQALLDRSDTVFWMPDAYSFPIPDDRRLVDQWLKAKSGRTLIFVGRDYDSAPLYWEKIKLTAPADKLPEIRRRLLTAKADRATFRQQIPEQAELEWFRHEKLKLPIHFGSGGRPPVVNGRWPRNAQQNGRTLVDPAGLELSLASRIDPPFEADVLLAVDGEILVTRQQVPAGEAGDRSSVIVVANASFLTNMALVNHEHRKLARQLVAELDPESQVLFLESDEAGLYQQEQGDEGAAPPSLQILTAPRLTYTFLHLAALGIIFGFSRWPIFGRAREIESNHESDFGRHVEALGELLERGGRVDFAQARIRHYHELLQNAAARDPAATQAPSSGTHEGSRTSQ